MAGVHQMMLHRAASGGGFTTYFGTGFGNNSGNALVVARNNSLSTMASNLLTGSVTISGTAYQGNMRVGAIFAKGNVVFSDYGVSTDGGVNFPVGGSYSRQIITTSSGFCSGQNGSYAYNPTTDRFAIYYTQPDKGSYNTGVLYYNATTGANTGNAFGSNFSVGQTMDQILYSPARDRYYVFRSGGLASTFNGTTGAYETAYQFPADYSVFKAGVSQAGNVLGFLTLAANVYELREYTATNFTGYNSLGTVSGLTLAGSARYMPLTYLPVNQKYAMVSWPLSGGNFLYFSSSNAATPNQFTTTNFNTNETLLERRTGNIFEDTNGDIYICFLVSYQAGKDSRFNTVSYVSTNGGASFTRTTSAFATVGPLAIAKNLL